MQRQSRKNAELVGVARAKGMLLVPNADVDACPKIAPLLERISVTGRKLEQFLQASSEKELRHVLDLMLKVPYTSRYKVEIERYCLAAKIDPQRFFKLLMGEIVTQTNSTVSVQATVGSEKVVQKTLKLAQAGSDKHAKLILTHTGFLPQPKTSVTFNKVQGTQVNALGPAAQVAVLPNVEMDSKRVAERFQSRMIDAPPRETSDIDPIDVEDESSDDDE